MSWDHYWHNILNVGFGKLSQGIINLKSCTHTLPPDQSTLIDFLRKNQSFGLHRKFGRAEIPSKGIKHMEIYGQFIYIGWEWMKRAVGRVTTCSKILILNEAHSHPKRGEMLEWRSVFLAYRLKSDHSLSSQCHLSTLVQLYHPHFPCSLLLSPKYKYSSFCSSGFIPLLSPLSSWHAFLCSSTPCFSSRINPLNSNYIPCK